MAHINPSSDWEISISRSNTKGHGKLYFHIGLLSCLSSRSPCLSFCSASSVTITVRYPLTTLSLSHPISSVSSTHNQTTRLRAEPQLAIYLPSLLQFTMTELHLLQSLEMTRSCHLYKCCRYTMYTNRSQV